MWKKLKGYPEYKINKSGQIKRNKKLLKNQIASNGYVNVCLCRKGKPKVFRLHRLLAITFIPNPQNKPCVNHKDGNRKNNTLANLEWVTFSENMLHAIYI